MNAREKAAKIAKLRKEIALLEAQLGGLREDLARLERAPGDQSPVSGLDLLWNAALPKSRERSSRHQCRVAWNSIPKHERPDLETAVAALRAWNKCEEWSKEGGKFAPGLHLFISRRRWEDVPEVRDPIARYRPAKPTAPAPVAKEEDFASEAEIAAILGSLTRKVQVPDETP
jgi:hypothetical protein